MNILRRASTRQLIIGIVAIDRDRRRRARSRSPAAAAPSPPHRSLASALHVAAAAKPVQGVTARVQFTDHLVASGSLGSSSPLISGATGRIWAGSGKLRLELQSSAGDTEIGFDGKRLTVYDVSSGTAYTLRVPDHHHATVAHRHHAVPSVAEIRKGLAKLAAARRPERGHRRRHRRAAELLGARVALAQRRPAGIGRAGLGRDSRRAASDRRLQPHRLLAGALARR